MKLKQNILAFLQLIGMCCWAFVVVLFYLTILVLKLSPFILVTVITIWFITQVLM